MKRTTSIFLLLLALPSLFLGLKVSYSQVRVTEVDSKIPTYEVEAADPNPIFYNGRRYQGAQGRVYPYPLFHNLSTRMVDRVYREIIIENEWVRISILPELGGRVHFAQDKRNGYNYIYYNEVIKPALIGMTGAWVSGGVEWNIPHHHRATSFMPVDYTITEQVDGSKTVWVGETEWRHRTRWVVGVTLHPDSTLFETTIRIFNTTPVQNTILTFANAAVHANENYQVLFPPETQWTTFHRKNQFSQWPISYQFFDGYDYSEGVDVSYWKNHAKPTSFFEWGNRGNFIAGIDHGEMAGTVIFGNKHENPGKKLWSWGNNPTGALYDVILTDKNGSYIELMFGSYSDNQPDYSWMQAYETKEAVYWFAPLKGLSDVKKVNQHMAIAFDKKGESLHVGVNAHQVFKDARIQVFAGGSLLHDERKDLDPDYPFLMDVELRSLHEINELSLTISDASGQVLISYTPLKLEEGSMPEPVAPIQDIHAIEDADSLYYQGLYYEQFHDAFYRPRDFYKRTIELNPQHVPALLRTGFLYLNERNYEVAIEHLERAVERVAWDYVTPKRADSLYYLALAYKGSGRSEEAYDLLYKASWDYNFRSAAHYQMALMKSLDGEYPAALEHAEKAYATNIHSVDLLGLKAALHRRMGNQNQAGKLLGQLLNIDPLNFKGYHEKFLLTGNTEIRGHLTRMMRDSRENYLELAIKYRSAGHYEEARDLLLYAIERGGEELSSYPIIHYYLGYFADRLGNKAEATEHFLIAGSKPFDRVFPFRFETLEVLEVALQHNPDDGLAWYYIGNIYYDHQPDRAITAWERALTLRDDISVAYRNLAFAYANAKDNFEAAVKNIRQALRLNPADPRYYYEQDTYLKAVQVDPQERLAPFAANHDLVIGDHATLVPYAELLTLNGKYAEAIDLMQSHPFRRWEGGMTVYPFWIYAHVNEALSAMDRGSLESASKLLQAGVSYPVNLETVRNEFETLIYYYKGIIAENTGNDEEARRFFEQALKGSSNAGEVRFFAARAYEKLGKQTEAESIYRSLIESGEIGLEDQETVDFLNPFSRQRSRHERAAEGYFRMALGYAGLGDFRRAREYFDYARGLDPSLLSLVFSGRQNTRF